MFFVILYMKGCSISYYVDEGLQTKKIDWGGDWGCRIISEEKSRGGGGRFTQKAWGGIPKMQKNKINGVGGVSSQKNWTGLAGGVRNQFWGRSPKMTKSEKI